MIERVEVNPPSCRRWAGSVGKVGRRLGVALIALLLAFLTSVVHVAHTCREDPVGEDPVNSGQDETSLGVASGGESSHKPCLACMFVQAIRSTLVSGIVFIVFSITLFEWLESRRILCHPLKDTLPCLRIRAPPCQPHQP
jgi:hypothetical protein